MGGVDRGDQHRVMGAGFANVSHFKKWYKKAFLGVCDFGLLNAFTAWNLSVDSNERTRGVATKRKLLKWEFYSVVAEELMSYVDNKDDISTCHSAQKSSQNTTHFGVAIDKSYKFKNPTCVVCSTEESVKRKVLQLKDKNARSFSRRKKHLAVCAHEGCNLVAHTACPNESKLHMLPQFAGLSCFEIAHHRDCKDLYYDCVRGGQVYTRSLAKHPLLDSIKNLYADDAPRRSVRTSRGRPRKELERIATTCIASDPPPPLYEVTNNPQHDLISAVTTPDTSTRRTSTRRNTPRQSAASQTNITRTIVTRRGSAQQAAAKASLRKRKTRAKRTLNYTRSTRNTRSRRN